MSEEEYLAHFVKLLITLEEECETPSIGVQIKHLLDDSIIAERNTDYLPLHKFVTQYDLHLQESGEENEFRIITETIFTEDELKSIMAGGEDE